MVLIMMASATVRMDLRLERSGSPVLNADGEFVAINFDRQRQGLMNECALFCLVLLHSRFSTLPGSR